MSQAIKITINDAAFRASMSSGMDAFRERLLKGVELACTDLESEAKQLCPKDTGHLMQSIKPETELHGDTAEGVVGTDVEYAVYVHEGTGQYSRTGLGRSGSWSYQDEQGNWHHTSGQKAQPFLEDALNRRKAHMAQIIQSTLGGGT